MENEFISTLLDTGDYCGRIFDFIDGEGGNDPKPKAWKKIPHAEWIPAQLLQYGLEINGCMTAWKSKDDGSGRPACTGRFDFKPLEVIYGNWHRELGLVDEPATSRMHHFKVVDLATSYLVVGLYHDEAQDAGLYVYEPGGGAAPYPLHLDLSGYVQLLAHSLGYAYWQLALLALLPDDGQNPAYRTYVELTAEFRHALSAWNPEFDYDTFVALYKERQLKNYTPSSELTGS
jgi:hypothetical protein